MQPKVFQVPAIVDGVSPLKDGGMSIRYHTQEVNSEMKMLLIECHQKFGWLQFSEQPITDAPSETIVRDKDAKTPSQRLRGRMFVYYTKMIDTDPAGFDDWYARKLEAIGNQYLERINESI